MTAVLYAVILFTATLVGPSLGQYGPPTKGKKHHVTVSSTLPPDVANLNYNPISTPLPDNSIGSSPEPAGAGSFPGASFPIGTVSQPAQQPSTGAGCGGVGSGCTAVQPQRDPNNPFPFLNSIKPTASGPVVSCSTNGYACVPKELCRNGIATSTGFPQTNSCNTQTHECCRVSNIGQPSGVPGQGGCAGVKGGSCGTGVFQQPGSPTGTRPSYGSGNISPSPNPPSYGGGSLSPSASFPSNSFKPGPGSGVPGSNGIPIGGSIYDGTSYPVTQSPNERPYTGPLNTTPHPGCAAALKCVPETYCNAEGVMVSQPVFLTREQAENRVPMTDCQDPDTGIIGKCCRDPNYKDPWPGGMMNNGDFTECSAGSTCQVPEVCGDQNKVRPFQNCLIPSSGNPGMCCYVGGQQSGGTIFPSGVKPLKKPISGYPAPQSKPFPQQIPVQPFPQQQIPVQPTPGVPSQQPFPQQSPSAQPFPQKPSSIKPFPTQQTFPQKFPTIQPLPLKPSPSKPIAEQVPSQQPLPQQFPVIKPLPQKPSSIKPYPQQLPTQQAPSAQPFPQQPSSAQPFPQQTPSAQPFPQQHPSAQPFPQQTPSAQPFPQRPSSAQPFPQQTPSAQPFPQQPPSAQPFPQQPPSAQPFPQQTPSAQPFPQQPSSAKPFPQQPPSAQPFPQQPPSAQPFPQQLPSAQPFPQQVPSAQPFPQKPTGSQTFPQKPSGSQYFPNQSPSPSPFPQRPSSTQPLPQHGSTAQPFPQKPGTASPFPQQSISSQPFPQKPTGIQPFPQQFPSTQTPHQQPIGSQLYPRPSAQPFPQQPQTSHLFPQQSPSSQTFPQQRPQSQQSQGSQFPILGSSQTGSYPSGGQPFAPQQQPGYTVVPGEKCGVRRQVSRQGLANTDAGFGEFPWQALIIANSNQSALCSAAIVSDRAVITAAHCLQNLESSDISVKAGMWKLHSAEQPKPIQQVEAAAIARHPKFDAGSLFNDLAVVLLEEPLYFDEHVDKICLPPSQVEEYEECIATGWGKAALQGNVRGSILHQIPVQMISRSVCEEKLRQTYLGRYFILNPSFQCAVPKNSAEDLCKVDAGGPIACHKGDLRYVLAGVYSWDVGCATSQSPTAFGGIDIDWINSVLSRPIDDVARDELNEILKQQQQQELSGVDIDSKPGFSQGYGKK